VTTKARAYQIPTDGTIVAVGKVINGVPTVTLYSEPAHTWLADFPHGTPGQIAAAGYDLTHLTFR
jgi:hypothetical protein